MTQRTIAVVGAGIGGLAFAALAAKAGNSVQVFDRFDAPRPVGSGLVIQPVGQAVLRAAGAHQALDLGQPIHRMLGYEVDHGRCVLDVTYDVNGQDRFGLAIHRASLFQPLYEAALAAGVDITPGQEVTSRHGQSLCFADARREGPFDLIVDAGGASSPLSPLKGRELAYGAIWGSVPWPETTLPIDHLSQRYRRADRMIGALPIGRMPNEPGPMAAIFWSLGPSEYDAWRAAPLEDWKDQARRLWPDFAPFLDPIRQHDDMTMARYSHGTLIRPIGDGMAHIGDAAHRASPQLGQGANMALLDAQALALALGQHHHLPDALTSYAKARRWHILVYQVMSAIFTPQYQSGSRVQPMIRDRLLAPLARLRPMPLVLSRLVCGDMIPPMGSLYVPPPTP